jgi:hypothetical protein
MARRERKRDLAISVPNERAAVTHLDLGLTEPPHLEAGRNERLERGSVGRHDRDPAGRQRVEQLGLRARNVFETAELLEMRGRDGGDHSHIGAGDVGECPDLPRAAHPHLGHDDLGIRLDAREREWKPDLVVEAGLRRD